MAITSESSAYPVHLTIDHQPAPRRRLTVFFRIIWIIPAFIVIALLDSLILQPLLLILFRRKYPQWWFSFNLELARFSTRVGAYLALLTDAYPSTDEEQGVHLDIEYPNAQEELNRWLPLVKWLLAIPHFIVLMFLGLAAMAVVVIGWFAILFTGSLPVGLHNFVVGVMRWGLRVQAYALLLMTDRYPPFSLDE